MIILINSENRDNSENSIIATNKTRYVMKTFFIGACIGLVVSIMILLPLFISSQQSKAIEASLQMNLVNSGGRASEYIQTYPVEITVKNDYADSSEMSVSPNGFRWYAASVDSAVVLRLTEGKYNFRAAYKNKLMDVDHYVSPDGDNHVELDIGKAPDIPEIVYYTLEHGQVAVIPLAVTNADDVTLVFDPPNGAEIKKEADGYALIADCGKLPYGFTLLIASAVNKYGSADIHICLTIPRETPVIEITTVDDLINVNQNLAGNYLLMNDLDMTGIDFPQIGSSNFPFIGTFDGGGHTIHGYTVTGWQPSSGIFDSCRNAVIQNLIIRDVNINCEREYNDYYYASICSIADSSMFQNCASIGGAIAITYSHAAGIVSYFRFSVMTDCFNSTSIINNTPNDKLPNTAGIASINTNGYIESCANEGYIYGNHLISGINAFVCDGVFTRCLNSGMIYGHQLINGFPQGALMTTIDAGRGSYGYFLEGASAAGRVYAKGAVIGIKPIDKTGFRDKTKLVAIGNFGGKTPDWAFASIDAFGPVPFGVFKEETPIPVIDPNGSQVSVSPSDDTLYFYSTDGSDPYVTCPKGVESISLKLKSREVLRVFAAKSGMRDSKIVEYKGVY